MSVRSRVAFATGVGGLAGATLILSGRFDVSVAVALLFVFASRASAAAALTRGGPVLAAAAERSLAQQMRCAPAWVLVVATGAFRSGSGSIVDVRGANAVAGLAIARGPLATVAGVWLAVAAGILALASSTRIGAETASRIGAAGVVVPPVALRRLEAAGIAAQAGLVVTLFAGPQITRGPDAVWWAGGIALLLAAAWRARGLSLRNVEIVAAALGLAGLALVIASGAP